jgi:WD40 repeat protein
MAEPVKLVTDLPADALSSVLYRLTLAHEIAAVAPTCRSFKIAAGNALKLRPFTGEVVTLAGHPRAVMCVAAAPDGRVITGSLDRTVKVWRDGACECTIEAHSINLKAVAVLPGGARFVSGSYDRTVALWTLDGALVCFFEVHQPVKCIAALPDGVHFVVGIGAPQTANRNPAEVRLYHVDGTVVHAFEGHTFHVTTVAVTPDGQHIISGSSDRTVKVWSVATKSLVSTCEGHISEVSVVAAMPDGQRFLSGGWDRTVLMWLLNGTLEKRFDTLHSERVNALVALPDNQHALSAANDLTVKLFNVNDGAVLRTFRNINGAHQTDWVMCLALLPDGRRFVCGSKDKSARIVEHGLAPLA